jgi:hypothetical protein
MTATPTSYGENAVSDPAGVAVVTNSANGVLLLPAPKAGATWNTVFVDNEGANPGILYESEDLGVTVLRVIGRFPALTYRAFDHLNVHNPLYVKRIGSADLSGVHATAYFNASGR